MEFLCHTLPGGITGQEIMYWIKRGRYYPLHISPNGGSVTLVSIRILKGDPGSFCSHSFSFPDFSSSQENHLAFDSKGSGEEGLGEKSF